MKAKQETTLPTNVRALLVARLDRLSQNVKEVVQTASVLGREFEIQLLAHMLQDDPMVGDLVVQAENMSIWSALNELRYLFKHALLRDAAYRMQIRSRRQALHKLATTALESLHEGDLGPHYGELAYHAEQARLFDKARHNLESAAGIAKDAYQNSLALDYLTRALKLTPAEDLDGRFRLLLAREKLHSRQGARQEQVQDLDALAELAEQMQDPGKQAQALLQRAWFFWWTADYPASIAASEQAARLAESTGQLELSADAYYAAVWVKLRQGLTAEAQQFAEKALVDARQAGDRRMEASVLSGLGLISGAEGDHYASRKSLEEALAINRAAGKWPGEGTAIGNVGVAVMILGDYAAAKDLFLQALTINREQGSKLAAGSDMINLGWNAETQGEWTAAIQYAEKGTAILREAGQSEMVAEGLLWLGHALLGAGRPEKAFAAYRESLKLRRELEQEHLAMGVLAGMSRAARNNNRLPANDLPFVGAISNRATNQITFTLVRAGRLGIASADHHCLTHQPSRPFLRIEQRAKQRGDNVLRQDQGLSALSRPYPSLAN